MDFEFDLGLSYLWSWAYLSGSDRHAVDRLFGVGLWTLIYTEWPQSLVYDHCTWHGRYNRFSGIVYWLDGKTLVDICGENWS